MKNSLLKNRHYRAFTLVELLTVISIIAVLMGLLFPTINAVKETARKTQAKNDVTQLVTAVKAYYTEYGKYPIPSGGAGGDYTTTTNSAFMDILTAEDDDLNPRQIVFFEGKLASKDGRYGIQENGDFEDPWTSSDEARLYNITIDGDYDNEVTDPGGSDGIKSGVIAWSTGKESGYQEGDPVSWK